MIEELRIRNLGVVEDATLVLRGGMTALTGETGAGKTMIVEAIRLLAGGKVEGRAARTGADEAIIEARFVSVVDGEEAETVVSRTIPAEGRSRAYLNGNMVAASALADVTGSMIDLHGQLGFHSLLSPRSQREALDRYAGTDVAALAAVRHAVVDIKARIAELSGDDGSREREIDLLRYQLEELDAANVVDPSESELLKKEEEQLANVTDLREASEVARISLDGSESGGASAALATAIGALRGKEAFAEQVALLEAVSVQLNEASLDIARVSENVSDDPERLAEVQQRRHQLRTLERKYGPTLADVIAFQVQARERLEDLTGHDEALERLGKELAAAEKTRDQVESKALALRKKAAPGLAKMVEARLAELALKGARFRIDVDGKAGDDVDFMLGANAGMDLAPLAKAASGGELARAMLALRLSLMESDASAGTDGPSTLVFDEVDAGVGGEAAVAVGSALRQLGENGTRQVLVVTHLPQVAAFADQQMFVSKQTKGGVTAASIRPVSGEEREVELARMLAGKPDSKSGREHARELLQAANAPSKKRSGRSK